MTKAEWSGWVQAIGSILAILASAGVVIWQVRKQHKLEVTSEARRTFNRERDAVRDACTLANYAMAQAAEIAKFLINYDAGARRVIESEFQARDFDLIDLALASVDRNAFKRTTPLLAFLRIQKLIYSLVQCVKEASKDREGYTKTFLDEANIEADALCKKILVEVETLQQRLGSLDAELKRLS